MVSIFLGKKQEKHYRLIKTLFILFISYTTGGLCNNGFISLLPFVSEEFGLTRMQIGYYSSFFFSSAALLAIFSGNIVDKLGPKKSILWGIFCMGIALFLYGWSSSYQIILLLAIFSGLGMSFLTPSIVKGTSVMAPPERQALFLGMVQSGSTVGSIIGPAALPIIAVSFNWRISIQISAIFTLLIGSLIYFFYQEQNVRYNLVDNRDNEDIPKNVNQIDNGLSFKKSIFQVLINKALFLICVLGIVFGIAQGSALSHFTIFLTEDIGLNRVTTGFGFATLFIGGVTGMAGLGWISDIFFKENRQFFLFLIGLFNGLTFLIFSIFSHNHQINLFLIIICTFFLGLVSLGWSGAYFVVIGEVASEKHAGMATGLSLFFIRTGIMLAPICFGYIADLSAGYQYSWFLFGLLIILISSMFCYRK